VRLGEKRINRVIRLCLLRKLIACVAGGYYTFDDIEINLIRQDGFDG
jgi:hypothetical protein